MPSAEEGRDPRVVVVGAGLAGLSAAYRLHQAGVGCRVFEATSRVGGRCSSSRGWRGGMVGEHGGEWVDSRHVHLTGLAQELGIALVDRADPTGEGGEDPVWVDGAWGSAAALLEPMQGAIDELARSTRELGPFLGGRAGRGAVAFDEMTVADWFTETVGEPIGSPTGRFLTHRMAGWNGLDPTRLGAGNLVDFFLTEFPGDDVRFSVDGGADRIPTSLAAALPPGTITHEAPVRSIRATGDGTYHLGFQGVRGPVAADHVIVSIPFGALRAVDLADAGISAHKRRAIDELVMGSNAKLLMEFDPSIDRLCEGWTGVIERADDPLAFVWESGRVEGSGAATLLTSFFGGSAVAALGAIDAHAEPDVALVDRTLDRYDVMIPGIRGAFTGSAWLDVWELDPWARGSYAAFGPGQITSFLGTLDTPEGGLHFAGEHTSQHSQGYMEGAVESGARAATEVLDALGERHPPGVDLARRRQARYEPVYPWDDVP